MGIVVNVVLAVIAYLLAGYFKWGQPDFVAFLIWAVLVFVLAALLGGGIKAPFIISRKE